jgi:hypothetical protein
MRITLALMMIAALLASGGCISSGVIEMGRNKYVVEYTSLLDGNSAKEWALWRAGETCAQQGRELYPLRETPSTVRGTATSSLMFLCLDKNDPQFKAFHNALR